MSVLPSVKTSRINRCMLIRVPVQTSIVRPARRSRPGAAGAGRPGAAGLLELSRRGHAGTTTACTTTAAAAGASAGTGVRHNHLSIRRRGVQVPFTASIFLTALAVFMTAGAARRCDAAAVAAPPPADHTQLIAECDGLVK